MKYLNVLFVMLMTAVATPAKSAAPAWTWYEVDGDQNIRVNLYLFWVRGCPHCDKALEFGRKLTKRHSWLKVRPLEIKSTPANRELYRRMAAHLKRAAGQTPAFFYCKRMEIGYNSHQVTGKRIESNLVRCQKALQKHHDKRSQARASAGEPLVILLGSLVLLAPPEDSPDPDDFPVEVDAEEEKTFAVPGLGEVEADSVSLPVLTLILAGCDAFNPCAFFVLFLLLSVLVHGQSRPRMLVVGGTFVFISGLVYFLFMAAWLNLFFLVGHHDIITTLAGAAALLAALFNLKDFFWWKRGPSLSIPASAKPGLFQRMTRLINVSSLPSLLAGTAALAIVVNLYELLCTSGFPMIYTRILTLRDLSTPTFYGYLALYNLIYVTPLALIVLGFVVTLGSRKLTEYEGRVLKLLSGMMMAALGSILLIQPEVLNSVTGAVFVLAASIGITALIMIVDRWRRGSPPGANSSPNKPAQFDPGVGEKRQFSSHEKAANAS